MPTVGEYHDNIESAMAAGLADVGKRSEQESLFDRADWLTKLKTLALPQRKAVLIKARSTAGECWLPLLQSGNGRAEALANYYNFTFRPIFSAGLCESSRHDLLSTIAQVAKAKLRRIDLEPLPNECGMADAMATAFRKIGWIVFREQCDENHILPVNGRSFDEYWASRPGKLRSTVKRKAKKNIVELRIDSEFTEQGWADYEEVYAQSWKPEEGSPEFLKDLARQESKAGALRLGLAYIDGKPVAAQFWTSENGTALIHKLAHVEDDAKASPGTLLTYELFRHVIDLDKVAVVDFGTGNDAYKTDWMEAVRPRYRITCVRPHHPANWPRIAKTIAKHLGKTLAARRPGD